MTLLRELQRDAVDSSVEITTLLRKARVLGERLRNSEFVTWVQHELNGYSGDADLPKYRILNVEAYAHLLIGFYQLPRAGVMAGQVPEQFRHWATTSRISGSVGELSSLVARALHKNGARLECLWPQELATKFGGAGYGDGRERIQCIRAWQEVSVSAIVGVLETVRNRLLEFVLQIEAEAPDAGEVAPGETPLAQERVTQIFNTYVSGGVTHIAASDASHVSNCINVGTMSNSQILQAGAHSPQSVSFSIGSQKRTDLEELVRQLSERIGELNLDDCARKKVEGQIRTIEAQLGHDEPDSLIIFQAGATLRNITEGAIGSLIASAAQPTLWTWVQQAMTALFPAT